MNDKLLESAKYLLHAINAGELNLGNMDVATLQDAIELVKHQTIARIVAKRISDSPAIRDEFDAADMSLESKIQELEKRIETLSQKIVPYDASMYAPGQPNPDLLPGLQQNEMQLEKREHEAREKQRMEEHREKMQQYEKEKAALEQQKARLEGLSEELDNLPQFLQTLMPQEPIRGKKTLEQHLIDVCATNMANGYMAMQTIGKEPLFRGTGANFDGYVPNHDKIKEFLELISNAEGIAIASNVKSVDNRITQLTRNSDELRTREEGERIPLMGMQTPTFSELAGSMADIAELIGEVADLPEPEKSQSTQENMLVETSKNPISRLFNRIRSTFKKQEQNKKQDEMHQDEVITPESVNKLNQKLKTHKERLANDQEYRSAFAAYSQTYDSYRMLYDTARTKDYASNPYTAEYRESPAITKAQQCRKRGVDISVDDCKYAAFSEAVDDARRMRTERVEAIHARIEKVDGEMQMYEAQRRNMEPQITPQVATIMQQFSGEQLSDISQKYLYGKGHVRYGVSPLAAALTLNILYQDRSEEFLARMGEAIEQDPIDHSVQNAEKVFTDKVNEIMERAHGVEK